MMSWSQSGTTHSVFIRFLMVSSTAWNRRRYVRYKDHKNKSLKEKNQTEGGRRSDNRQPSHKRRFSGIRIALWWADGIAGNLTDCQLYFNEPANCLIPYAIKHSVRKHVYFYLCHTSKMEKNVSWIPISSCVFQVQEALQKLLTK